MNMEMRLASSLSNASNASYERMWTSEGDPGLIASGINVRRVYKHNESNRRLLSRISEQLEERRRSGRCDWRRGVEPLRRFFLLTARRLVLKRVLFQYAHRVPLDAEVCLFCYQRFVWGQMNVQYSQVLSSGFLMHGKPSTGLFRNANS